MVFQGAGTQFYSFYSVSFVFNRFIKLTNLAKESHKSDLPISSHALAQKSRKAFVQLAGLASEGPFVSRDVR